jgi:hypothetical protein
MNINKMTIFFLIIGTICFGIAAFSHFTDIEKSIEINEKPMEDILNQEKTNKDKGNAFEDYFFDLLMKDDKMKLLSKTSDYYKNGRYAEDNSTPDFKFQYQETKFAVECKYRGQFVDGKINWAKTYQIKNYNNFEKENNQKVFVAIGIGGTSYAPEKIYFVPLFRLTQEFASESYINEFKVSNVNDVNIITTKEYKK